MADPNEREALEEILRSVQELMDETRQSRQELHHVSKEVKDCFQRGELSEIGYRIRLEQINRSHQNINFCLRKLEQQRKVALEKLRRLD